MSEVELRAEIDSCGRARRRQGAELDGGRQLISHVMDAEDRARQRIAQLIHDDALQSLLAANQELIDAPRAVLG